MLPVMRTGGASSGLFNFPKKALVKPDFVEEGHWEALQSTEVPTAATAEAVVALAEDICNRFPSGCGRSLLEQADDSDAEENPLSPVARSAMRPDFCFRGPDLQIELFGCTVSARQ